VTKLNELIQKQLNQTQ